MSQQFVRNLNIHTKDLGVTATLLLTFNDQLMEGIYTDYFPVAWKVTTFEKKGKHMFLRLPTNAILIIYIRLCVIKPQVSGKVVTASTWMDINLGQRTDLTHKGGVFSFSNPTTEGAVDKRIQAWNKTDSKQGFGFDSTSSYPPTIALYFPNVGSNYNVTAQFKPLLKAYIVTGYLENEFLRGAVQTPVIWEKDLSDLDTNTSLTLSYQSSSGTFLLEEDDTATAVIQQPIAPVINDDLARIVKLLKDLLGDVNTEQLLKGTEALGLIANGSSIA